jgi:hypothetical protein
MTGIRSLAIRRRLMWAVAVAAWACSNATEVDQTGGDSIASVVVSPPTSTVGDRRAGPVAGVRPRRRRKGGDRRFCSVECSGFEGR